MVQSRNTFYICYSFLCFYRREGKRRWTCKHSSCHNDDISGTPKQMAQCSWRSFSYKIIMETNNDSSQTWQHSLIITFLLVFLYWFCMELTSNHTNANSGLLLFRYVPISNGKYWLCNANKGLRPIIRCSCCLSIRIANNSSRPVRTYPLLLKSRIATILLEFSKH